MNLANVEGGGYGLSATAIGQLPRTSIYIDCGWFPWSIECWFAMLVSD